MDGMPYVLHTIRMVGGFDGRVGHALEERKSQRFGTDPWEFAALYVVHNLKSVLGCHFLEVIARLVWRLSMFSISSQEAQASTERHVSHRYG
jgi:hypothetical protein